MPVTLFLQAKITADKQARASKSQHVWGVVLFKSLRRVLAGKSRQEIMNALYDARGSIEQRSLQIPHDRIVLLSQLKALEQELLNPVAKEAETE